MHLRVARFLATSTKAMCIGLPTHTLRVLLAVATVAVGCAATPPELDPYNRPYTAENLLTAANLRNCVPDKTDRPARLLSGTRPHYPVGEMLSGRSGRAILTFEVSSAGAVRVIGQTAENQWFASHAAIAMRDWKVTPAEHQNKPVTVVCRLAFDYVTYEEAERRKDSAR
jgi:outer membrane biosynthesis protein TonB